MAYRIASAKAPHSHVDECGRIDVDLSEEAADDTVAELAQEAAAVEAELAACHSAGGQLLRVRIGSLGLSFVFYGLSVGGAQGVATTAIGSLITALNAMHPQAAKEKLEIEELKGKPAFALVKAKELLATANRGPHCDPAEAQ